MALFSSQATSARPGSPRAGRWKLLQTRLRGQGRRVATVGAAALVVAMGFGVVFGHNGLTVYNRKRLETRQLDRQLHDLQHENDNLQGHVERLQSDPDAIEHQAREELHYTRPGEVIVTLPPDKLSKTHASLPPAE